MEPGIACFSAVGKVSAKIGISLQPVVRYTFEIKKSGSVLWCTTSSESQRLYSGITLPSRTDVSGDTGASFYHRVVIFQLFLTQYTPIYITWTCRGFKYFALVLVFFGRDNLLHCQGELLLNAFLKRLGHGDAVGHCWRE